MRAFVISLALLAGITGLAAVGLGSLRMSAQDVYSSSDTRH